MFFGSARLGEDGPLGRYYAQARELARLVTEWPLSLPSDAHRLIVCSGGGGGLMEAANHGAADAGGRTIGLNICGEPVRGPRRAESPTQRGDGARDRRVREDELSATGGRPHESCDDSDPAQPPRALGDGMVDVAAEAARILHLLVVVVPGMRPAGAQPIAQIA